MRIFTAVILIGLLALPLTAQAAGNVLVPSDNKGSSGSALPNLGYSPTPVPAQPTPTPAPQAAAPQPVPQTTAAPNTSAPLPPRPLPAADLSSASLMKGIPVPPTLKGYSSGMVPMPTYAGFKNPTKVIKMQEPAPLSNEAMDASDLKSTINIEISDKSAWGPSDLQQLAIRLGVSPDKVPSLCHLSLSSSLQTSEGLYPFDSRSMPGGKVKYNGSITGMMATVNALCKAVPLPDNSGHILQVGDFYQMSVGVGNCPAADPSKPPQKMVFLYQGNSKSQCYYQ